MNRVTIQRPDDWHVHLRDGAALESVVKFTAERFGRAIVMPNLKPAITTTAQASAYRARILAALPAGARDRKSTRLNSSHSLPSRMPSSA